jgi:hypothetical protein
MRQREIIFALILALIIFSSCTSRSPTIAHVHIGHALTGWVDTPDKQGFIVVAEKKAQKAFSFADKATGSTRDIKKIKINIDQAVQQTNSRSDPAAGPAGYGVRQALIGAINHIIFSATSDDASQNIRSFAPVFKNNAMVVIDRCDLITALGDEINALSSLDDATVLAAEILTLTRANLDGDDFNGDGVVGSDPSEYGLAQLRRDIEAMLDREDPPYTTVDTWYLFNLIRLPSGKWGYRQGSGSGRYGSTYD